MKDGIHFSYLSLGSHLLTAGKGRPGERHGQTMGAGEAKNQLRSCGIIPRKFVGLLDLREKTDRQTNMQKHLSRAIWNHTGHFYLRLCSLSGILYKYVCTPLFSLSYKLTKGSFCFYLLYPRYVCMPSIGNCT